METAGSPLLKLPGFVGRAFDPHPMWGPVEKDEEDGLSTRLSVFLGPEAANSGR